MFTYDPTPRLTRNTVSGHKDLSIEAKYCMATEGKCKAWKTVLLLHRVNRSN